MGRRCRAFRSNVALRAGLALALATGAVVGAAQDHAGALRTLDGNDPQAIERTLRSLNQEIGEDDRHLTELVRAYLESPTDAREKDLRFALEMRTLNDGPRADPEAVGEAARKSVAKAASPDPGITHRSNWLGRVLERLKNFRMPQDDSQPPDLSGLAALGPALLLFVKLVLALVLAGFLVFAFRHFRWRRALRRRAAALLEDEETERTPDGWLERSERLAADGRYREAVRCLYLACLLRFDEHGVARFERHETNWEHLHRISRSPKLPANLDFRPPTAAFDRIWYGQRVKGQEDYDAFVVWYSQIVAELEAKAA